MAKAAWLVTDLAAGITPTGSATAAGLGWDKLLDVQPRHRARVAATSAFFVRDLGSAQAVDCATIESTTFPAACTVRLRASTSDPNVTSSLLYDSGVVGTVTDPKYNGNVINCLTTPITARYWRWDIASATNPIDIGLAQLGLLFRPGRNFQYGAQEGKLDLSDRVRNEVTGAEFAVSGPKIRTKTFSYNGLAKAETRDTFGTVFDVLVGASGDVLFVEDPDASWLDRARDSIWGSYRGVGADSFATRAASQIWARPFRLTERL